MEYIEGVTMNNLSEGHRRIVQEELGEHLENFARNKEVSGVDVAYTGYR